MNNKVVFLDRDGVINYERNNSVKSIDDFEFIFDVPNAIKKLNEYMIKTIIVTNEEGIELGLYTKDDFLKVNDFMVESLKKFGADIDAVYYSPWIESPATKPEPGMLKQAIEDYNLKKCKKYMIGDKLIDIEAGNKIGCKTILLKSGNGKEEYKKINSMVSSPFLYLNDLKEAVEYILND